MFWFLKRRAELKRLAESLETENTRLRQELAAREGELANCRRLVVALRDVNADLDRRLVRGDS